MNRVFLNLTVVLMVFSGCGGGSSGSDSSTSSNSGSSKNLVNDKDVEKPKIKLIGAKKVVIKRNEPFSDPGVTVFDKVDGNIPSSKVTISSAVDISKVGEYIISYQVSDKAGNIDTAERTVYVVDVVTPTPKTGLHINEVLVGNTNSNYNADTKQFSGWIELYNNSNQAINLRGYSLSDGNNSWNLPSQDIPANDYFLAWTDLEKSNTSTQFKLDMDGGTIILKNGNGVVDTITFPKQKIDISFTEQNGQLYYMIPTPKGANSEALSSLVTAKKPKYSLKSGFYPNPQTLELTQEEGGDIFYTLDGSIPSKSSQKYTTPISITKNTVVRTRSISPNHLLSSTKTRTYLINENVTLPVISLAINDEFLNDPKIGINVVGVDDSGRTNPINQDDPNYMHDWVRSANIEYLKDGKSKFNENIGIKIHGAGSRHRPEKSFTIYAKKRYGASKIDYQIFEDKNNGKFTSLLLRNAGGDNQKAFLKDALNQGISKDDLDVDYQAYQPSVVFINGNYWGMLNIRETTNDDYLETNYNVDKKNIDILYNDNIILKGSDTEYKKLQNLLESGNSFTYDQVDALLDIPAYIDYLIAQMYVGNVDWPGRNRKYWREKKSGAKWRYFLYDLDDTLHDVNHDTIGFAIGNISGEYNLPYSTKMIKALMNNDKFKNQFTSKFTTCLNTIYKYERVHNVLTSITEKIEPEIQRHFQKWTTGTNEPWISYVNGHDRYYSMRNDIMRSHLYNNMNVMGENLLTIPALSNGKITIDNIKLKEAFSGSYFDGAQVTLKAIPDKGYKFEKWNNGETAQSIVITMNSDISIEAQFTPFTPPKVVISEINYKSDKLFDTGEWIEIYNNEGVDIDISGWSISDNNERNRFTIPANTILKANQYMVFVQNSTAFKALVPNVNVIGDFKFNLSKKKERIRLFNSGLALVDSVSYDKNWPDASDNGHTLFLLDENSDNQNISNWSVSTDHGTPGKK